MPQRQTLEAAGVAVGQGFLLGRPDCAHALAAAYL